MEQCTREDLRALMAEREGPCVSIFMPTYPGGAEADPVRFQTQLDEAESRLLAAGQASDDIQKLLRPARALLRDKDFWKNTSNGLAYFLAPGFVRSYRLALELPEQVVTGKRLYVKPMLSWFAEDGRFFILALSQGKMRFLEASAHDVRPVEVPGAPANLEEAMRTHDRDEILNVHSHPAPGGRGREAIFHGHGVGIDDAKDDVLRYFQQIDKALHPILRLEHAPLVVAAVDYLLPLYKKANSYSHLLEEGVPGSPDRLSGPQLKEKAWPLVAPMFRAEREQALGVYRRLAGTGRTVSEAAEAVRAACRGELETLFLVKGKAFWGKYDEATGKVETHPEGRPGDEDLMNLAAIRILSRGGAVHLVEEQPGFAGSPVAGVLHLPLTKHGK